MGVAPFIGGGFNPASFGNLVAYYDARKMTSLYADGTALAGAGHNNVPDYSGNGNTITAGAATYYSSTAGKLINGNPAIYFNSSLANYLTASFTVNQPYTIYIVCQQQNTATGDGDVFDTWVLSGNNNPTRTIILTGPAGGQTTASLWSGTQWSNTASLTAITTPQVVTAVFNGASSVYRRNGVGASLSPANPGTTSLLGIELGGANVAGDVFEGLVGALLVYSVGHSSGTSAQIEAGIGAWFGIAA